MPGEFPAESGREFVNRACLLLHGNFGFSVYQTCYEGEDAATVNTGAEVIRFDFIMTQLRRRTLGNQTMEKYRIHFFCECKRRSNPRDLKRKLKDYLLKVLKTMPVLQRRFSGNFYFLFICNKPFGISQENLESVNFLKEFLDMQDNPDLNDLSRKIGILFLTDWFLETVATGV